MHCVAYAHSRDVASRVTTFHSVIKLLAVTIALSSVTNFLFQTLSFNAYYSILIMNLHLISYTTIN